MANKSDNTWKKTSDKSKTTLKAPPCIPLPEKLGLSPNEIKRQHIPQVSQKPTFTLSVQDSDKNRVNFLQKMTLQKEIEEKKRKVCKKLKQERQDKHKLKQMKRNSTKKPPVSIKTVKENELSTLHTPCNNIVANENECTDTHVVSLSVDDEFDTRTKLSTFNYASTSSQLACHNLLTNQKDGECEQKDGEYEPSVSENTESMESIMEESIEDKIIDNPEYLEVTGKFFMFLIFTLYLYL